MRGLLDEVLAGIVIVIGTDEEEVSLVQGEVSPKGAVVAGRLSASRVATSVHRGNYDDLGRSWQHLAEWAGQQGLALGDRMWEVYVTEPRPGDDPADMVTELYWMLRP